jgi:hypothetical protein
MNLSNVTGQQMVVNVSHTVLLRANKLNYASHSSSKTFTFVHYKHLFCKLNSRIPILKVNILFNLLRFKQFDCSSSGQLQLTSCQVVVGLTTSSETARNVAN